MKKIAYLAAASMLAMATAYAGGPTAEPTSEGPHWTGFYLGGDFGYMWGESTATDVTGFNAADSKITYDPDGGLISMHGGYQHLWARHYLTGLEVQTGWMGLSGKKQYEPFIGVPTRVDDSIAHTKGGLFVGLFGRLGLVEWKKFLFYGKGGYEWSDVSNTFTDSNAIGTTLQNPSEPTRKGGAFGGGMEYSVDPHWTVTAEYMSWAFGDPVESKAELASTGVAHYFRHALHAHSVTVGASYHFA